jgi:hypothetical protein
MQSSIFASCLADYFALLDCLPGLIYRVHFTGRYTERLRVSSALGISQTPARDRAAQARSSGDIWAWRERRERQRRPGRAAVRVRSSVFVRASN